MNHGHCSISKEVGGEVKGGWRAGEGVLLMMAA